MKVKNVASSGREIAATGQTVEPGGTAEVSKKLGVSLCEQPDVWQEVKTNKQSEDV